MKLNEKLKVLSRGSAPNSEDIQKLSNHFFMVPQDYLEIVKEFGEVELGWGSRYYLRIWKPSSCIDMDEGYFITEDIKNGFPFGDNGGCEFLLYLPKSVNSSMIGVYLIDYGDISIEDAVKVANSVQDLISNGNGLNLVGI